MDSVKSGMRSLRRQTSFRSSRSTSVHGSSTHQSSRSRAEEAVIIAQANGTAAAAARSVIMSGGNGETAYFTARAAAISVLTEGNNGSKRFSLSHRKAKRQSEVIASMALMSMDPNLLKQNNVGDYYQHGQADGSFGDTDDGPSVMESTFAEDSLTHRSAGAVSAPPPPPRFTVDSDRHLVEDTSRTSGPSRQSIRSRNQSHLSGMPHYVQPSEVVVNAAKSISMKELAKGYKEGHKEGYKDNDSQTKRSHASRGTAETSHTAASSHHDNSTKKSELSTKAPAPIALPPPSPRYDAEQSSQSREMPNPPLKSPRTPRTPRWKEKGLSFKRYLRKKYDTAKKSRTPDAEAASDASHVSSLAKSRGVTNIVTAEDVVISVSSTRQSNDHAEKSRPRRLKSTDLSVDYSGTSASSGEDDEFTVDTSTHETDYEGLSYASSGHMMSDEPCFMPNMDPCLASLSYAFTCGASGGTKQKRSASRKPSLQQTSHSSRRVSSKYPPRAPTPSTSSVETDSNLTEQSRTAHSQSGSSVNSEELIRELNRSQGGSRSTQKRQENTEEAAVARDIEEEGVEDSEINIMRSLEGIVLRAISVSPKGRRVQQKEKQGSIDLEEANDSASVEANEVPTPRSLLPRATKRGRTPKKSPKKTSERRPWIGRRKRMSREPRASTGPVEI